MILVAHAVLPRLDRRSSSRGSLVAHAVTRPVSSRFFSDVEAAPAARPTTCAMSTALKQLSSHRIAAGIGRMTDLVFERGAGSYIWTADGDKYLDMTCGIGVTNTGHCHPKVVEACQQQIGTLIHGQVNIAYHKPMLELCERLGSIMPYDLDTFFFWNSGAEAVEAAIKLARHATKRPNVIVFQGGYHGRTIGTMSLTTSKRIYRAGYGPLMPGVHVSPFPVGANMGTAGSPPPSHRSTALPP